MEILQIPLNDSAIRKECLVAAVLERYFEPLVDDETNGEVNAGGSRDECLGLTLELV